MILSRKIIFKCLIFILPIIISEQKDLWVSQCWSPYSVITKDTPYTHPHTRTQKTKSSKWNNSLFISLQFYLGWIVRKTASRPGFILKHWRFQDSAQNSEEWVWFGSTQKHSHSSVHMYSVRAGRQAGRRTSKEPYLSFTLRYSNSLINPIYK